MGPTIHPCTKGIWIWGAPLSGFTAQGEPINVLVLDSEGLGGLDEDSNHDMRIFSLALLMSSFFVYNSIGQIDEMAIQNLSMVVNLTQFIRTKVSQNSEAGSDAIESIMPNFLWVLRDFSLQLEDEKGNEITSKEYLEKALSLRSNDAHDTKNKIRENLCKYFKNRDCTTMVRPLMEEDRLQSLEEMEIESLRTEFIEQVVDLRRKLLNRLPVKKIQNHVMDGATWAGLIQLYVKSINSG